jgi:hypothetical protein
MGSCEVSRAATPASAAQVNVDLDASRVDL